MFVNYLLNTDVDFVNLKRKWQVNGYTYVKLGCITWTRIGSRNVFAMA